MGSKRHSITSFSLSKGLDLNRLKIIRAKEIKRMNATVNLGAYGQPGHFGFGLWLIPKTGFGIPARKSLSLHRWHCTVCSLI